MSDQSLKSRKQKNKQRSGGNLAPRKIRPKTDNQSSVFDAFDAGQHLVLTGYAGTGKTFISSYLAITDVLAHYYTKLIIVRSVVPTRDMGFLPGRANEKIKEYEAPYYAIFNDLFERGDAYDILKQKHTIEFMPTSFIRGITINDAIIVVDEIQNMTDHELNSVITRVGDNTKLILCGDIRQSDLIREHSGFKQAMEILARMDSVSMIEFGIDDIVRSGFTREYIIAREEVKDEGLFLQPRTAPFRRTG